MVSAADTASTMDLKDSVVNGRVLIVHQIHEGKHHYEVENVVKSNKGNWKKLFVRRGDKLMQINGVDLQDLTPEELAQMLAEGNPMLTVHKPGKKNEHPEEQSPSEEDILCPVSKETTTLSFSWEMTKGDDFKDNEVGQEGEENEAEEDVCPDKNEENEEGKDLLVIEMTKTSISLVRGRGCDPGSPCQGCNGTGCVFNDIVVVSESSTVTLVPRGNNSFKQEKLLQAFIEHVPSQQYVKGFCSQKTVCTSPNPENITIYYYKYVPDKDFRGRPVVLNFTGSNCFLRCCKVGSRILLQVETCEKQKLKRISKSDESTLSFVFYMKGDQSGHRTFESALNIGWFINIVDNAVEVKNDGQTEEQSFVVIIQK